MIFLVALLIWHLTSTGLIVKLAAGLVLLLVGAHSNRHANTQLDIGIIHGDICAGAGIRTIVLCCCCEWPALDKAIGVNSVNPPEKIVFNNTNNKYEMFRRKKIPTLREKEKFALR